MTDTVIRAVSPLVTPRGVELRGAQGDGRTLTGHFAVWNTPAEINSAVEGNFVERISPGALARSMATDPIKVMLSHGFDVGVGDRPIATITEMYEDSVGAYYSARMLDGVPDLVLAGLRAGQYGASFRFRVLRERWDYSPAASEFNPDGRLAERTILEAEVREFGPVVYPAYSQASAELRSLTDWFHEQRKAAA